MSGNITQKVWLIGVIAVVCSCDSSELFLEEVNDNPSISIIDSSDTTAHHSFWLDSAKLSSGAGLFPYRFQLAVDDFNENIEIVNILKDVVVKGDDPPSGLLLFQYDTILIDLEIVNVDQKEQLVDIEILCFDESFLTLSFIVFDEFMRSDTATLQLDVFDNLKPVVDFEIKNDEAGELVRVIDLSNSYDGDADFGGQISSYHWLIEGTEFSLTRDFIRFSFPEEGRYDIEAYVTDNNGAQSDVETIEVVIQ